MKMHKNCCPPELLLGSDMHEIIIWLQLCPRPHWESLQCSPRLPSWFRWPTGKRTVGPGWEGEKEAREVRVFRPKSRVGKPICEYDLSALRMMDLLYQFISNNGACTSKFRPIWFAVFGPFNSHEYTHGWQASLSFSMLKLTGWVRQVSATLYVIQWRYTQRLIILYKNKYC